MTVKLILGDNLDVMRTMADSSVDAICTDPPAGINFMKKKFDSDRGGRDAWVAWLTEVLAECLRVAKPGAHALIWALPRTSGWTHRAIEDGGWEVRDCVTHLFGSGFPKSLDVSKAMDKRRDDTDPALAVTRWTNARVKRSGVRYADILRHFGFRDGSGQVGHWTAVSLGAQPAVPTWDQWLALKSLLDFGDEMDAEVWRLNGRKGQPGEAWFDREITGERSRSGKPPQFMWGEDDGQAWKETAPATDLARQWDGWGSNLKPAAEFWYLARKPLAASGIAANVAAYGTGAINVAATRITAGDESDQTPYRAQASLPSVLDGAQCTAAALRACSTDDIDRVRSALARSDTSPLVARCDETSSYPPASDGGRGPSSTSVQDSLGDCPACRRFGDALIRRVQEAAQADAPSLADALVDIASELPTLLRSRDHQCDGHPSTADALRQFSSLLNLLDKYTTTGVERPLNGRDGEASRGRRYTDKGGTNFAPLPGPRGGSSLGRWPANVILDEDSARALDAEVGERKSGGYPPAGGQRSRVATYGKPNERGEAAFGSSSGGVSRYFYCAKASRAERNAGLEGMPEIERSNGNKWTDQDYRVARGERTPGRESGPRQNHHPTVKPLSLMRWLVRLITPPNGTVFDPFTGSGSTGCACVLEGFSFIGIDSDSEYVEIARRRIEHAQGPMFAAVEVAG